MKDEKDKQDLCFQLVRNFELATRRYQESRREQNSAEVAKANAEQELVKRLVPGDYKVGDVFYFPVGNAWLEVRIEEDTRFESIPGGGGSIAKKPKPVIDWRNGKAPSDKELGL